MKITICEEHPTQDNLINLKNIDFPVNLILAAPSLEQFYATREQVKQNVNAVGYWPTLSKEEGYWLSPFSERQSLKRIISELANRPQKEELLLMWDAELPLLNLPLLFNQRDFPENKKLITQFLKNHESYNLGLSITEPPTFLVPEFIQRNLGVAFDPEEYNSEKIKMAYTSFKKQAYGLLGKTIPDKLMNALYRREVRNGARDYGSRFSVGIGCLLKNETPKGLGIGHEPRMTPEELEYDLQIARDNGVANALIFRLGGVDEDCSRVLKKFAAQ